MELTAKAIREVEFREKLRGYHPEDVDAFVEEIAAGIEALEQRSRDGDQSGFSGATGKPPAITEGGSTISEDTLRRTLIMAQRTADLVLSDAQDSAAEILAAARSEAEGVLLESKAQARRIAGETERQAKAAQHDVVTDLARMEAVRDRLTEEIATLGEYLDTQRARIREALLEQLHVLEGARTQLEPPPAARLGNGNGSGPSGSAPAVGPQRSGMGAPMARNMTGGAIERPSSGSPRPASPLGQSTSSGPPYGLGSASKDAGRSSVAADRASETAKNGARADGSQSSTGADERRPGRDERGGADTPPGDVDVFSRGRSPDDVFLHDGDGEDPFLAGLRQARDEPARFDRGDADRPGSAETPGSAGGQGPRGDRGPMADDDGRGGRMFRRN